MTIAVTEQHQDLRDAVRAFTAREVTPDVVRSAVDAEQEQLPAFWPEIVKQGLLAVHLPESVGGAGFGLVELAVVCEELGRGLVPGPYLPTVLTSAILHRAGHRQYLAELASGELIGAVALGAGSLTASRDDSGRLVISGESQAVLGGQTAGVFVLPVADGAASTWVVLPAGDVEVAALPSHDPTRRLATIRVDNRVVDESGVLDRLAPGAVSDVAATLFAAESSGLADWCTGTAAEYARSRHQFGRPVGQFQGVKHRCARMLARAEQARACAWDAARANDPGTDNEDEPAHSAAAASLAAAVAGSVSVQAAFDTAKDCIQTLGGIGFTWEHAAGFYLRRSQTLRILLGATGSWQRRVAELAMAGERRELSVELPEHAAQIRERVRAELAPATELDAAGQRDYLAEHGFAVPHLPEPWGRGADAVTQLVIAQELRAAELEPANMVIGAWVVPTLIEHGSTEQQQRFLPPTLNGDLVWCQLFSEPGAGSDLAALSTRAERVDGGWKVSGQKVWTSKAREADWAILLARTDAEAPKHRGISYFLLDMSSPGIEIRPLRELTGDALFNEVFLDEVFVPDEMLVGEQGKGWKLARTTLANERVALSSSSALGASETLVSSALQRPEATDAERLSTLGRILGDAQSGALLGLRSTLRKISGQQPGAESSIAKLLGVENVQEVWETAMEWRGPDALDGGLGGRGDPTWMFLNSRCLSIAGGTTDVQLNIIGERLLGLPRDPEPPQASA